MQYFFLSLGAQAKTWCDQYIDTFVALSSPWLGAMTTLRTYVRTFLHSDLPCWTLMRIELVIRRYFRSLDY